MSVSAWLTMRIECRGAPRAILEVLLRSKWKCDQEGWWGIPLDREVSDWTLLGSSDPADLRALFDAKLAAQQVFGVQLLWEGGEVGGNFLVTPDCELWFSAIVGRVKLGDRTTDVSWYLSRLLPLFQSESGVCVEWWKWEETG